MIVYYSFCTRITCSASLAICLIFCLLFALSTLGSCNQRRNEFFLPKKGKAIFSWTYSSFWCDMWRSSLQSHFFGLISTFCMDLFSSIARGTKATYRPTNLPTYLPTDLPTYWITDLPTYWSSVLPTYQPTDLLTYWPSDLPTYRSTDLPIYRPTDLPIY